MLRFGLTVIFLVILASMLVVTTYASLDRSILDVGPPLTTDPWFHATLADAYFGFVTFYVWVVYKEGTWLARISWLVLIMMLGNIAMAIYILWQLFRVGDNQSMLSLLLNQRDFDAFSRNAHAISGQK